MFQPQNGWKGSRWRKFCPLRTREFLSPCSIWIFVSNCCLDVLVLIYDIMENFNSLTILFIIFQIPIGNNLAYHYFFVKVMWLQICCYFYLCCALISYSPFLVPLVCRLLIFSHAIQNSRLLLEYQVLSWCLPYMWIIESGYEF